MWSASDLGLSYPQKNGQKALRARQSLLTWREEKNPYVRAKIRTLAVHSVGFHDTG